MTKRTEIKNEKSGGILDMTFYTFMIRNHLNEDTPAGDLAQDMRREKKISQETVPVNLMDGTN